MHPLLKKVLLSFVCCLIILGCWEICSRIFSHLLFVLPPPSKIFATLFVMRERFCFHSIVTLKEMCGGFLLALTASFPLAWMMLRFETARTLLQPLFILIQCLPMFTLAPIMVIWFGWSYTAIVIPTALMIFFPLTLNIYQGLKSTPVDLLEFFQINQASGWQTFFKLRLPWAVPHIFGGFRISAAIAGVGAVAGEWAGAQNGLGILMLESRRNTDLEITFGALFCLALMSLSLYALILYLEKIALPPRLWKFTFATSFVKKSARLRKKNYAFPLLILVFFLLALGGCKKVNSSNGTRLLLDWLPNPNHVPLYVGVEKGFFQEEGISLFIQKMHENGGGISYLTSNQADLLINHLPGTLKACSKGAKLNIVGLLIKEPLRGFIYREEEKIQNSQDLSGRVLGYCIGGGDTAFLDFLLEQGKIYPSEKKNVSVDLISAIGTKSVDFIYGGFWNIEPCQLRSLGVKTNSLKIQELGVSHYYEMIIIANVNSKETTPPFVYHFQKALQKSIEYCKAHPEESFACYLNYNKDKSQKTREWEKEAWTLTYPLLANNQDIDLNVITKFYEWQLKQAILKEPFSLTEIIP